MRPIGGYFELELPQSSAPWHSDAIHMTSGRAALRMILETLRPRRVHLPFYTCDTVVQPARACGAEIAYYPLTPTLEPDLQQGPGADECLIYINYFGICTATARQLTQAFGMRLIVDDTQAFFARGYAGAWSFNSARKYFGVPDGSYLYPARPLGRTLERNRDVCTEHLVSRLNGKLEDGFTQYQASEARVTAAPLGMSAVSERLLGSIDYAAVRVRRRENYRHLEAHLASCNRLPVRLADDDVPFCYPLELERAMRHEALWREHLFVPKLWREVIGRPGAGFARERALAASLLPLPVDHRYDAEAMDTVIQRLAAASAS